MKRFLIAFLIGMLISLFPLAVKGNASTPSLAVSQPSVASDPNPIADRSANHSISSDSIHPSEAETGELVTSNDGHESDRVTDLADCSLTAPNSSADNLTASNGAGASRDSSADTIFCLEDYLWDWGTNSTPTPEKEPTIQPDDAVPIIDDDDGNHVPPADLEENSVPADTSNTSPDDSAPDDGTDRAVDSVPTPEVDITAEPDNVKMPTEPNTVDSAVELVPDPATDAEVELPSEPTTVDPAMEPAPATDTEIKLPSEPNTVDPAVTPIPTTETESIPETDDATDPVSEDGSDPDSNLDSSPTLNSPSEPSIDAVPATGTDAAFSEPSLNTAPAIGTDATFESLFQPAISLPLPIFQPPVGLPLPNPSNPHPPEPSRTPRPTFIIPTRGVLTSRYGWRWGRMHYGIDIGAPTGTPVIASAGGWIRFSGWRGGYGNTVEIRHFNGSITRYAHHSRNLVVVGQHVQQGQAIALVGSTGRSTGPHLHFELHLVGRGVVNPLVFLPQTIARREGRPFD